MVITRVREVEASLLDGRIDTLNRNAVEAYPAKQIFRTVSAILALVRVSALLLRPSANFQISLMVRPGQNDCKQRFRPTV